MTPTAEEVKRPDCDPCICGDTETWHKECYSKAAKTRINYGRQIDSMAARIAELEAENARLRKPSQEPAKLPLDPIYYMRDDHTSRKLSADVDEAMAELEAEFDFGCTYGMLCSKRPNFKPIHAGGREKRDDFLAKCRARLEALK